MTQRKGKSLIFDDWVRTLSQQSSHPLVKQVEEAVSYCLELSNKIPDKYGWRYSDVETIGKLVAAAASIEEVNKAYWKDQARNAEAYAIISYWRGMELLRCVIESLNNKELIVAAVISRSYLELAAVFIENTNTITHFIKQTLGVVGFPQKVPIASEDLEKLIVRIIWGTRLGDAEAYLQQKNIMSTLKCLAKHPSATELTSRYNYLCELAHPNFIGNARFWSHIEKKNPDGSETRVLMQYCEEGITSTIVDNILWALSWSSICMRNGLELSQQSIGALLECFTESWFKRSL